MLGCGIASLSAAVEGYDDALEWVPFIGVHGGEPVMVIDDGPGFPTDVAEYLQTYGLQAAARANPARPS